MPDRVQFQLDAEVADGLGGFNKGPTHVVVPDQRVAERNPGLGRIPQRRGDAGVGHRHHDIGVDGMFAGQQPAQFFARFLHRAAENHRIRPREIHVLENAMRAGLFRSIAFARQPFGAHDHHLAGLDIVEVHGSIRSKAQVSEANT